MVYRAMMDSLRTQGLTQYDIISESYFYSLWSTNFQTTVIPKVSIYILCSHCEYEDS